MMRLRIFTALIALAGLSGCNPYEFRIIPNPNYVVEGKALSGLDTFKKMQGSRVRLRPGGIVALRVKSLTRYEAKFRMKVVHSGVVNINFRSVPTEFPATKPVTFRFAPNGSSLTGETRQLAGADISTIRMNEGATHDILMMNDGKLLSVKVDCEQVWATTEQPITEWIIVEAMDGADIELFGIEFAYLELDSYVLSPEVWGSDGEKIEY
ncbi:MAG: hypothetical protein ACM3U1_06865 [Chloroflexota bacterium]